jgi:hypothetical protein
MVRNKVTISSLIYFFPKDLSSLFSFSIGSHLLDAAITGRQVMVFEIAHF